MRSAPVIGISLTVLLALSGCATHPVAGIAAEPAARPASCPHSPVSLKVLGADDDLRLWYFNELVKRKVPIDPDARTTIEIEEPVIEDRRGETCLVLAARVICDGLEFSAHVIEVTSCFREPTYGSPAGVFFALAGVAAGVATGRTPAFPAGPADAPVLTMRSELVERIAWASH